MGKLRQHDLSYRKKECSYVTAAWQRRESVSLVGIGSVGKSNLLHHLGSGAVCEHYISSPECAKLCTLILDPHLLGTLASSHDEQYRAWAACELIMHRIYITLYPMSDLKNDARIFFEAYQSLQDGSNPLFAYMGLRYLELGLELLYRHGYVLILMFDELEVWLREIPSSFFRALRGLRDQRKGNLLFVTFSRKEFDYVVVDLGLNSYELEPFSELLVNNKLFVGPYSEQDANAMLNHAILGEEPIADHVRHLILHCTGNHAGLMRAVLSCSNILQNLPSTYALDQVLNALSVQASVERECDIIWQSLNSEEKSLLQAVVSKNKVTDFPQRTIQTLTAKGLLSITPTRYLTITPPLFAIFLQNMS